MRSFNVTQALSFLAALLASSVTTTGVFLMGVSLVAAQEDADKLNDCPDWAFAGECTLNPKYMLEHCPIACQKQARMDQEEGEEIERRIGHITSFFELEAEDIDEKPIKFDQFKGKVTVITNVASHCGYTKSHYRGMVKLYNRFKDAPIGFNILAFPCNEFGEQEPESCPTIKGFAKSKGVEFTMMNKIRVNTVDAHPVYLFLKKIAGPPEITWNFATYYVVLPDGTAASFSGLEPMELVPAILEAMGEDEVESEDEGVESDEDEESSEDEDSSDDDEDEKEL